MRCFSARTSACASRKSSASRAQFVASGVRKLRLTGGEPLLRRELPQLVSMLRQIPQVEDIALTTNGVLLPRFAAALREAG
jgi:Molybdenum cofactor biosynthesis enzyme